jgi:transposase
MDAALWAEIRRQFIREGFSKRRIGRVLRVDPRTINKALAMERYEPTPRATTQRASQLDVHRERIQAILARHPDLSAVRMLEELKPHGFAGGITIVRDLLRELRPKPATEAFATLAFPPGDAAQVDWAACGSLLVDGRQRRLSAFLLLLCHSRYLYVEFTLSERMEVFLACHEAAFQALGGVPRRTMYDNLRSVVLARAEGEIRFHPRFLDFSEHYGFQPVACAPYRPNEKGRVENSVRYLKRNFLAGRSFTSLEEINCEVRRWLTEVANVRMHQATHRRPVDILAEEQALLLPLPSASYDPRSVSLVTASSRCRVHFDGNTYSVPPLCAGQELTLKASGAEVTVFWGTELMARHRRSRGRHQDVVDPEHVRALVERKHRAARGVLVQRFTELAPCAAEYLKGLVHTEVALYSHLRRILSVADHYGTPLVTEAIEHALSHRAFGADYVERIVHERRRRNAEPEPLSAAAFVKSPELFDITQPDIDLSYYDRALGTEESHDEEDTTDRGSTQAMPAHSGPDSDPGDP